MLHALMVFAVKGVIVPKLLLLQVNDSTGPMNILVHRDDDTVTVQDALTGLTSTLQPPSSCPAPNLSINIQEH